MGEKIELSVAGKQALDDELVELVEIKRPAVIERIAHAKSFGDLSENSEYDEAKNEQALVEAKIASLEDQLKKAHIIKKELISTETVSIGTTVTILDVEFNEETTYRIASPLEYTHSDMETITNESPVGKALMDHKAGDEVTVTVPNGSTVHYKILKISL